MSTTLHTIALAGLLVGGVACGSDDVAVPTAEDLAEDLITVDTYDGEWSVNIPDDAPEAAESGVVTVAMQELIPRIDLCEDAGHAARAAVRDLPWMAFRQLDLEVDDPLRPPDDRAGHRVFVQELLTSGEPDEIAATFEIVAAGIEACLGEIPAGEEGPGLAERMELPDVGEDRLGTLVTIEEAGGWAEWRLHSALVRDGRILVSVLVVDVRADADPYFTVDEVGEMVTDAVDLL